MTRPDQNDEGLAPRETARNVVIEFSNSPHEFHWEESTPSHGSETRTSEEPARVRAIVHSETPAPPPKRIANRYDVVNVLGIGGQADVYLAEDTTLQRKVAIKIPRADHSLSKHEQEQFQQEARAIASLKHPGIVTVHDFGIHDDGRCFIVLEYLPGQSLKDCLKKPNAKETFTIDRSIQLISRIAEALHYAHQRGIYHRDLKPGNILLDERGNPRITDFGLAVTQESQRCLKGQVAGTAPYMAPEQVRGEAHWLNGQADIWALGIILYEMLAGRRPFEGQTEYEVKDEILHRSPTPLRQIDDHIPRQVEEVATQCLEKEAGKRYSTAWDLCEALRLPTPARELLAAERKSGSIRGIGRRIAIASVVLLVASLLGGGWLFSLGVMSPFRELGVWSPFSISKPRKLLWPVNEERATLDVNERTGEVSVETDVAGLLQLDRVDARDYDFRVQIRQPKWQGSASVGFFLGHRLAATTKDQPYYRLQAFIIASNGSRKDLPFSLDRTYLVYDESADFFKAEQMIASVPIKPENLRWMTIEVKVRNQLVKEVLIDGISTPALVPLQPEKFLVGPKETGRLECRGAIGLYIDGHGAGTSGRFRNAEIKIVH
ncbi:MAG: serine/threonine protein kinase [Pirellulaceae bacterium]|nr:serine/threonine protein kinase [Pirellulaceae bacterium]